MRDEDDKDDEEEEYGGKGGRRGGDHRKAKKRKRSAFFNLKVQVDSDEEEEDEDDGEDGKWRLKLGFFVISPSIWGNLIQDTEIRVLASFHNLWLKSGRASLPSRSWPSSSTSPPDATADRVAP